ncbi:MAG: glycosyltransferase family 2 protein [Patescibacteria group bacterium]
MDVSVVIVSWRVRDLLKKNLEALFGLKADVEFEVFVVDNNSGDGTVEMVNKEFPQVNLIANRDNLGFAKANNLAINQARGRYILLLNPDMQVKENTLVNMVTWMDDNPQAGVAGCKLIDDKGRVVPHVREFPRFGDQMAITLKIPHIFPGVLNNYIIKDFDYSEEREVDSIRGSFFAIRKEVIEEIGGLDERYFIWFEEVDYCRRVKEAGWKVMYTPAATCVDYVGKSFIQVPKGKTQKYFRDSMLKYFRKWHPAWQYWVLKILWIPSIIISRLKIK